MQNKQNACPFGLTDGTKRFTVPALRRHRPRFAAPLAKQAWLAQGNRWRDRVWPCYVHPLRFNTNISLQNIVSRRKTPRKSNAKKRGRGKNAPAERTAVGQTNTFAVQHAFARRNASAVRIGFAKEKKKRVRANKRVHEKTRSREETSSQEELRSRQETRLGETRLGETRPRAELLAREPGATAAASAFFFYTTNAFLPAIAFLKCARVSPCEGINREQRKGSAKGNKQTKPKRNRQPLEPKKRFQDECGVPAKSASTEHEKTPGWGHPASKFL